MKRRGRILAVSAWLGAGVGAMVMCGAAHADSDDTAARGPRGAGTAAERTRTSVAPQSNPNRHLSTAATTTPTHAIGSVRRM